MSQAWPPPKANPLEARDSGVREGGCPSCSLISNRAGYVSDSS